MWGDGGVGMWSRGAMVSESDCESRSLRRSRRGGWCGTTLWAVVGDGNSAWCRDRSIGRGGDRWAETA